MPMPVTAPCALALALAAATPCAPLSGQDRSPTDRSLGASLLAVSVPGPSAPIWRLRDSALTKAAVRFEAVYGRAFKGDRIGGVQPTVVLGLRGETPPRDSAGNPQRGAGVAGVRVGIRAGERAEAQPVSALEFHLGVRSMSFLGRAYGPDIGFDVVLGWGNLGVDRRASLGIRMPVEMVVENRHGRITVFGAPAFAWGHLSNRACVETRHDPCGTFERELLFGRARFLLAGGTSVTVLPARLSLVAGVQRLFAKEEETRLWIGTAWTP